MLPRTEQFFDTTKEGHIMSGINEIANSVSNLFPAQQTGKAQNSAPASKTPMPGKTTKSANYGATIGKPELSEEGAKYYEELKNKYKDMDFVLVSKDMIDVAKNQASSYGNKNRMVVLIDEEKIEKMASDESFRNKYENLIATAQSKMPVLQQMMGANGNIKTIGMQVGNDGRASFFAVMDKSQKDFQARIEQKRAAKKEAAKAAEKKAAKEKQKEKIEEKRADRAEKAKERSKIEEDEEDYEILMADSIEELVQRIDAWTFAFRADNVETAEEQMIGHAIDFKA
ncbi:MAG: hypothetical protein IJQ12_07200 [Lachnospiraceae bacterium]|nr:hypothetical protein [Lachnospiraceae bacterium]